MGPARRAIPEAIRVSRGRMRWYVVASVFLLAFITIVDRVCISAAKESMALELRITDVQFGWIFGAFTIGYAIFMVPGGFLGDRWGPRFFLGSIVCAWSLFTSMTGLMSALVPLFVVRLLFGVAEAGAYPTASRAIYSWTSPAERGLALGLLHMGSRIGAAFGLAITTFLILSFGWRTSFFLLGAAGFCWAVYWFCWYRDDPARMAGVSAAELEHIRSGGAAAEMRREASPPWTRIVFSWPGVLLLFQYFANNFTFFLVYSWFLPYLRQHFGLSPSEAGIYSGFPLYCGALATWSGGLIVDGLFRRGFGVRSRTLPGIVGFALAATGILGAAYAPNAAWFIASFGLAIFGVDLTISPSWSACADMGCQSTGAVSGAMNMMGSVGSFVSSVSFPYLFEWTGGIHAYCFVAALLSGLAALSWQGLARSRMLVASLAER
jgi:MFS transporter, ACS family, glucarate transporter